MTVANVITSSRILGVFVVIALLYVNSIFAYKLAFLLTLIVFVMDYIDGLLARNMKNQTRFGAFYDIIGDRIVEVSLLVVFATKGWISIVFPLIFVVRGFLVDGLHATTLEANEAPFAKKKLASIMERWLFSSRISRSFYGVIKTLAFCGIILSQSIITQTSMYSKSFEFGANLLLILATMLCIIRALPIIWSSRRLFL